MRAEARDGGFHEGLQLLAAGVQHLRLEGSEHGLVAASQRFDDHPIELRQSTRFHTMQQGGVLRSHYELRGHQVQVVKVFQTEAEAAVILHEHASVGFECHRSAMVHREAC